MLMIAPDHEKKPLGIFLITRVRDTSASQPVERRVVTSISGLFSLAKHRWPNERERMNVGGQGA